VPAGNPLIEELIIESQRQTAMPSSRQSGNRNPKLRLVGLGVELFGAIIGFTLMGLWADHLLDSSPWGVVIGIVLGCAGGFYNLIRSSLNALEPAETRETEDGDAPDG
jgi:F0F1-type ATP synthase assembly protein I